jgi:hypothetical protein
MTDRPDDVDLAASDALDDGAAPEDPAVRARLAEFAHVRALLADVPTAAADDRRRVLTAVAAAADHATADAETSDPRRAVVGGVASPIPLGPRRSRWFGPIAAAGAIAAAAAGFTLVGGPDPDPIYDAGGAAPTTALARVAATMVPTAAADASASKVDVASPEAANPSAENRSGTETPAAATTTGTRPRADAATLARALAVVADTVSPGSCRVPLTGRILGPLRWSPSDTDAVGAVTTVDGRTVATVIDLVRCTPLATVPLASPVP